MVTFKIRQKKLKIILFHYVGYRTELENVSLLFVLLVVPQFFTQRFYLINLGAGQTIVLF